MGEDCQLDSDCPGSQVCFVANKSWSNVTQCHCNTFYGFSGPQCADILQEPNGIFIFTVGMIGVPIALAFTVVAAHNVYHLFKSARHKKSLITDAVFLSSLYFALAGLFFVVYCSLMISLPLEPFQVRHPEDDSTMYRETIMQIFLTLGLMLIAFGIITISSGFLEMTFVLSAKRRRIIRCTLVVYKVSFAIILLTLVSSRMLFLAYAVAFPYIIVLAVAYIVGLTILTNKIKRHRAAHGIDVRKSDPAYNALQSAQNSIRFLCLALAAEIALGIFWLVVCYFIGWRYLTPPGALSPTMSGQVLWVPAVLAGCAVMKDLSQWRRIRVARISGLGQLTPKNGRSKFVMVTRSTPALPPASPQAVSELIPVTVDENEDEDSVNNITSKLSSQLRRHYRNNLSQVGALGMSSPNGSGVLTSQSPITSGEQLPVMILARGSSPDNNNNTTTPPPVSPPPMSVYSQDVYEEDGDDVQQRRTHGHRVAVVMSSEDIKSSGSSSYETKEEHEQAIVHPRKTEGGGDSNMKTPSNGSQAKQKQVDLVLSTIERTDPSDPCPIVK